VKIIKDPFDIRPLTIIEDIFPSFKALSDIEFLDIIIAEAAYVPGYFAFSLHH
jgi:predicted metallopeptidase